MSSDHDGCIYVSVYIYIHTQISPFSSLVWFLLAEYLKVKFPSINQGEGDFHGPARTITDCVGNVGGVPDAQN